MKNYLIGALIMMNGFVATESLAQDVVVKPIAKFTTTVSGQPIQLPNHDAEVTASIYEIPAGVSLPQHRHSYPRYGYVLSGTLEVKNAETGKTSLFSAGDFVVESINQWHSGENPGTDTLRLLVIDQTPNGEKNVELRGASQ
jgi:quercetin dioxygenase-like cupin family protein